MNALKTLAKGASIAFVGIVASKVISFFYRITLGRGLGPEEYGLIMLGIAVFYFGKKLSSFSVNEGIKRFMPLEEESKSKSDLIISAAVISIPLAIVGSIIMFSGAELISTHLFEDEGVSNLLKILAPAVPFAVLSGIFLDSMVGHERMKYFSTIHYIFQNLVKLVTALVAIALGLGSIGVAMGFSLAILLTAILSGFILFTKIMDLSLVRPTKINKIFGYSWPLFLSGMMTLVLSWTDTLMLGFFLDSAQVGIYNAAFPLAAALMAFMTAVSKIGFPVMSKLAQKNRQDLDSFFKTTTRWVLTFATPAFLLILFFPREILLLTFGSDYVEAYQALRILGAGFFISMLVGPTSVLIKATDHTKLTLFNTSLMGIGNVLLNVFLIPLFGIVGAAIASMVSKIIGNFAAAVEAIILEKVFGLSKSVFPIFIASLLSLVAFYIPLQFLTLSSPVSTLIIGATLYGILYLTMLVLLGGFKPEDREIIVSAGEKLERKDLFERIADFIIR